MRSLKPSFELDKFFEELATSTAPKLLLLDYDGTLAPFRRERDQALPYPGVAEALEALTKLGQTRIVLVSGRAVDDLLGLFTLAPHLEVWGSHGWERRTADGAYRLHDADPAVLAALASAQEMAEAIGASHHCERKPVGYALHWRGLESDAVSKLKETVVPTLTTLAQTPGLELHTFDGGIELRASGRNKGYVVRSLRSELGIDVPIIAYLGDDFTDEDAFAELETSGLSVLVRTELRPTRASLWIRPPEELLEFLHRWTQIDEQPSSH